MWMSNGGSWVDILVVTLVLDELQMMVLWDMCSMSSCKAHCMRPSGMFGECWMCWRVCDSFCFVSVAPADFH